MAELEFKGCLTVNPVLLKLKRLTITSVGEDVENWNPHTLLMGMQNVTTTL